MQAYLLVSSTGTKAFSDPPDSVCTLVAQFRSEIHPDHPLKGKAIHWELPHPEYLNQIIATKTDEQKWQAYTEIPDDILEYLNQNFGKSAREYPA